MSKTKKAAAHRVLLVDDQRAVRLVIRRMLERAGHSVVAFERPLDALSRLDSGAEPPPDAAVLDILMPEMTGIVLARELRRRFPSMPILFVTGYSAGKHRGWPADDGRSAFLSKPFTPEQLRDALWGVLG